MWKLFLELFFGSVHTWKMFSMEHTLFWETQIDVELVKKKIKIKRKKKEVMAIHPIFFFFFLEKKIWNNKLAPKSAKSLSQNIPTTRKYKNWLKKIFCVFGKGFWGEFCFWIVIRNRWYDIKYKEFVWKNFVLYLVFFIWIIIKELLIWYKK
jgi:hypothetical protein